MQKMWLGAAGLVVAAAVLVPTAAHAMTADAIGSVGSAVATAHPVHEPQWYGGPVYREDPYVHGRGLWAMAIAISDRGPDDPRLSPSVDTFESGYTYLMSVDCDLGAREGLGLRPDKDYWYTVTYFVGQEDAFSYKDAYGLRVVGIVAVTAEGCDGC